MTYGLVLIKGKSSKRNITLSALLHMAKHNSKLKKSGIAVENVFLSFGWPDFVLILKAKNVEQIRHAISLIREKLANHEDYVDTSTIICSTVDEIKEKKIEWSRLD